MMPKEAFNKSEFTAGVRIQTKNKMGCSVSRFIGNKTFKIWKDGHKGWNNQRRPARIAVATITHLEEGKRSMLRRKMASRQPWRRSPAAKLAATNGKFVPSATKRSVAQEDNS